MAGLIKWVMQQKGTGLGVLAGVFIIGVKYHSMDSRRKEQEAKESKAKEEKEAKQKKRRLR